jgi:hypothetical protein
MAMARFIKIGNERIKVSQISGFTDCPENPHSTQSRIEIKFGKAIKSYWFESKEEKDKTVGYLDKILETV